MGLIASLKKLKAFKNGGTARSGNTDRSAFSFAPKTRQPRVQGSHSNWLFFFFADENRDLNGHAEEELKRQRAQYNGDQLYSNVSWL